MCFLGILLCSSIGLLKSERQLILLWLLGCWLFIYLQQPEAEQQWWVGQHESVKGGNQIPLVPLLTTYSQGWWHSVISWTPVVCGVHVFLLFHTLFVFLFPQTFWLTYLEIISILLTFLCTRRFTSYVAQPELSTVLEYKCYASNFSELSRL